MLKINVTSYTTSRRASQADTKVHQSLVAAMVCSIWLVACSGIGPESADTTDPASREPTTTVELTTTTTSAEDTVRAAYSAYVAMIERIITTTVDPNDPQLPTLTVDPLLSDVRTQLSTWQAQGQVWVVGDQTRHDVQSVEFEQGMLTAVITDCVVANDALVPVGTTDVSLPSPSTVLGHTTMVNRDGVWMAQDTDPNQRWEGIAGCAD